MATAYDDDAGASDSKKSKQERIRDNQRRSRARRQEHLSDLEKRLADCHTICRDAELERSALKQLQVENARLRELLHLAGVNPNFIDTYVNHGIGPNDSSLRQLRPKISFGKGNAIPTHPDVSTESTKCGSQSCRTSAPSRSPEPLTNFASEASNSSETLDFLHANSVPTQQSAFLRPGFAVHGHGRMPLQNNLSENFCCDTFMVPTNGPLLDTTDDTILCSVAKELIEQYCVNADEMEMIKARLATGFCKPAMPNQGCRVNNQVFFEVLNNISSKWA